MALLRTHVKLTGNLQFTQPQYVINSNNNVIESKSCYTQRVSTRLQTVPLFRNVVL